MTATTTPGIRPGFTLLEVVMSLALFSLLMISLLEAMAGARSFTARESIEDDLTMEGERVISTMVDDFARSAWYIPTTGTGAPVVTSTINQMADQSAGVDRSIRYYPYVLIQTPAGMGSQFNAFNRIGTGGVVDPTRLPPTLPLDHQALSQEVVFLRIALGPPTTAPAQLQPDPIDFNPADVPSIPIWCAGRGTTPDPTVPGSGGGVLLDGLSLGLDPASGVIDDFPLTWESAVSNPNPALDEREYTYQVVPNPVSGKGELQRAWRNGCSNASAAPLTAETICEDCDRIVVDTYRTAADLQEDQIRIAIYLSRERPDMPGVFVTRRVELTTALRSTSDGLDPRTLADRLGPAGGFVVP